MLHIYAALAEQERRMISERTRKALAAKKAQGIRLGNPNLAAARQIAHDAQAAAADAYAARVTPVVRELQAEGVTGMRAIAAALNDRGIPLPRGGVWYSTSVINLMRREP